MNQIRKMRAHAVDIFKEALNAVDPFSAVKKYCRTDKDTLFIGNRSYLLSKYNHIYVIGFGKATAPMAEAMESLLEDKISGGLVIVKYGHVGKLKNIHLIEAGHPIPDANGISGTKKIIELAQKASQDDLVLCLISGGGSALLSLPAEKISLKDKQKTNSMLLSCGASIHEINTIRKHLSMVKGGNLAQKVYPGTLVSLILSDVVGDDLDIISSGPTVPDSGTFTDCMKIISTYQLQDKLPETVKYHIQSGARGEIPETPKADDPIFEKTQHLIIGSNMEAILAAQKKAIKLNYNTIILSSMIEGETKEVAKVHTAIANEILKTGHPVPPLPAFCPVGRPLSR